MTLHLICAFQVIKFSTERVLALFHDFLLQFLHIAEIGQKAHNTTTPGISQILTTFNLYSGKPRMSL